MLSSAATYSKVLKTEDVEHPYEARGICPGVGAGVKFFLSNVLASIQTPRFATLGWEILVLGFFKAR